MDTKHKVAVLVGSLSKASLNRKMSRALIAVAPPSLELSYVEIGDLPLYTPDFEADPPAAVRAFREQIAQSRCAAVRDSPSTTARCRACLKNAIDVGSRPYGKSVWGGKPAAVVSVSPGAIGGFGANHHLRQSFVFLDVPAMPAPEAYIGGAAKLFDEQGALTNESTREFITKFMQSFAEWVERIRAPH